MRLWARIRERLTRPERGSDPRRVALQDYRPESLFQAGRVVISTIEGPRFAPDDFDDARGDILDPIDKVFAYTQRDVDTERERFGPP